jgi:pterin-4a-carbinolamine dehydratase
MSRLDDSGIAAALGRTPGWEQAGAEIRRTYRFGDFREALAFVNRVGSLAATTRSRWRSPRTMRAG